MSARLYRVLFTDEPIKAPLRTRVWLRSGEPLAIHGLLLQPTWDRHDELWQSRWLIQYADGSRGVAPFASLAMNDLGDCRVIPRAIREDAHGRMEAVLVEVQHLGPGRPIWHMEESA